MKVSELIATLADWLARNGDDTDVYVTTFDMPEVPGVCSAVTEVSEPDSLVCFIRGAKHEADQ